MILAEIFSWWVARMRGLLPGAALAAREPDALIVAVDRLPDSAVEMTGALMLRRNGHEDQLGALDPYAPPPVPAATRLATGLRLPPGNVLCRDVTLPLAAARDLQSVLGFELDRLTPFSADELYWSVSGVMADRGRGMLTLRLAIVLRARVEALLETLERLRLTPSFIETGTGRIELAAAEHGMVRHGRAALIALCGLLALACVAVPFIRQQIALNAAARAIEQANPAARTALALRGQLEVTASGNAAIDAARREGDALQVLAVVTQALPDGTWLSDLTLKSGDLTFDGESGDAAQLIGLLSAVPGLRTPSFTAPVTRTADGKADLFSMHATVAP
jgi:general secretion pathway protein L